MGPALAMFPVSGLSRGAHLQPALAQHSPTPFTGLHCHARAHRETLQTQKHKPTASAPGTSFSFQSAPAAGLPPPLCVRLQPDPDTTHIPVCTPLALAPLLPVQSLATGVGGATEDPKNPGSHAGPPQCSPRTTQCWEPQRDLMLPPPDPKLHGSEINEMKI